MFKKIYSIIRNIIYSVKMSKISFFSIISYFIFMLYLILINVQHILVNLMIFIEKKINLLNPAKFNTNFIKYFSIQIIVKILFIKFVLNFA